MRITINTYKKDRRLAVCAPSREPSSSSGQSGYIGFGDAAGLLWRKKPTLLICAAVGLVLGVLLVITQDSVYRAKASIEVQMPNEDYLNRRQLNPIVEPSSILLEPFMQTQLKLVQTDTILLNVIDQLAGPRSPNLNPPPGPLASLYRRMRGQTNRPVTNSAILENVRKRLTVRTAGQTQIIELLFESSDPGFAAAFLNTLTEEYRKESRSRMVDATTQTAEMLSTQIEDLKKSVDGAEKALSDFVGANSLLVSKDRESFIESELRQTQTALGAAHDARVSEESHYDAVRKATPDEVAKVLDSDTLRAYRVRLTELRQKLAEAVELYKPAHYTVRQIQAEIKEVETAFERERAGILARLQDAYRSAKFREDSLRNDYERQAGVLAVQTGKSVRYTALQRDVDTRRQLYESLVQKVKEAGVVSAMQASNVRVLDPAVTPEAPIRPNRALYVAMGLSTGILSGLILVLAGDRRGHAAPLNPAYLPAPEIARLGSIPDLNADSRQHPEILPATSDRGFVTLTSGLAGSSNGSVALSAIRRKDSEGARAFQSVVNHVLFSAPRAKRPRVVTVTSACHGEGRTTVLCNLGAALARTGRVVLIIDGDRINPRLHDIFGIPNETGFTDLIASYTEGAESAASEAVWMTEIQGLFVLQGGRAMGRLASLMDDPRTTAVLDGFCRDFDVILIDAPPVLSTGDAVGLSRHSDAVLLVVREGCASVERVDEAVRQLAENGAPIAGKIVNYAAVPEMSHRELGVQ